MKLRVRVSLLVATLSTLNTIAFGQGPNATPVPTPANPSPTPTIPPPSPSTTPVESEQPACQPEDHWSNHSMPYEGAVNLCTGFTPSDQRIFTWGAAISESSLSRDDVWAFKNLQSDFPIAYKSGNTIRFFHSGIALPFSLSGAQYVAPTSGMYLEMIQNNLVATAATMKITLIPKPDCGSNVYVASEINSPSSKLAYTWGTNCQLTSVSDLYRVATDPSRRASYTYDSGGWLTSVKIGPANLLPDRTTEHTISVAYDAMTGSTQLVSMGPCGVLDDRNNCTTWGAYKNYGPNNSPLLTSSSRTVKNASNNSPIFTETFEIGRGPSGHVKSVHSPISSSVTSRTEFTYSPFGTTVARSGEKSPELFSWRLNGVPGELLRTLSQVGTQYAEMVVRDDRVNGKVQYAAVSDRSLPSPTLNLSRITVDAYRNTLQVDQKLFGMSDFQPVSQNGIANAVLGLLGWTRNPISKTKTSITYAEVSGFQLVSSVASILHDGTSTPVTLPARSFTYTSNNGVRLVSEKLGTATEASHSYNTSGEYVGSIFPSGSVEFLRNSSDSFLVDKITKTSSATGLTSTSEILNRTPRSLAFTESAVTIAGREVQTCERSGSEGPISCERKSLGGATLDQSTTQTASVNNGLNGVTTVTDALTQEVQTISASESLTPEGSIVGGGSSTTNSQTSQMSSWMSTPNSSLPQNLVCSPINCHAAVAVGFSGTIADGCGASVNLSSCN